MGFRLKSLQIITSAYNEEGNVEEFYRRISEVLSRETHYSWSLVFFDNASSDSTWDIISKICDDDPRVTGYRMTRTFTLDVALSAGIDLSSSDLVITMASDLQDDPELIPQFLRQSELGFDFVVARVNRRDEIGLRMRLLTKYYYKLANWLTDGVLLENVSDFRLMSKKMCLVVKNMNEQHRFLRGLTAWTGFQPAFIDTHRPARFSGKTKTKFAPVFKLALRGILSHSDKPINLISWFGITLPGAVFILMLSTIIYWLIVGVPFSGFGTLISLQLVSFSLIAFFLGIIAQYTGLIYMEVKKRPLYIIKERRSNDLRE